jgi:hypothetical protein
VASLPEDGSRSKIVFIKELKRRVPSASTKMPEAVLRPGTASVVTVASRAVGRARLAAEGAAMLYEGTFSFFGLVWGSQVCLQQTEARWMRRRMKAQTAEAWWSKGERRKKEKNRLAFGWSFQDAY